MKETCETIHKSVVEDKFSKLPGMKRTTPGDCYCLDCHQSIPAWWNRGNPIAVENAKKRENETNGGRNES